MLVLCGLSFLVGRYVQPLSEGGREVSVYAPAPCLRRLIHPPKQVVAPPAGVTLPLSPHVPDPHARGIRAGPIDPQDPAQLEAFFVEGSGLMGVRPPLPPAQSGDDFYHVIPFQVRKCDVWASRSSREGIISLAAPHRLMKRYCTCSDGGAQILSWAPRIVVYPAFVDKARCDHIIRMASKRIVPSGLAYALGEKVDAQQQTRTSQGVYLSHAMDPDGVLTWVEERIAAVTLLPRENGHRHSEVSSASTAAAAAALLTISHTVYVVVCLPRRSNS